MSHAWGEVLTIGTLEVLGYFEFDGTSGMAIPDIFNTREELTANWRKDRDYRVCPHEVQANVIIYAHYGSGIWWYGEACFECNLIDPKTALLWIDADRLDEVSHGDPHEAFKA